MQRTILVVDDEESICQSLKGALSDEGYEVWTVLSGEECLELLKEERPDLILLDIWLPGIDGIEALTQIKARYPEIEVVMISGHGTVEAAVTATKLGAFDFIEKPLSLDKVILVVDHALALVRLEEENKQLKDKYQHSYEIQGHTPLISDLREMIDIISPTNAWILIMGENGTGKELVARSIYRKSRRADKAFVEVNCAAIPEELIESELFGHEKGAFTGATTKKRGKFDLAHEGTLFLDEVADMSLKAQAKILRILQEKKFERVGGNRFIHTDVRVLAATNKDLETEMEEGRFRQDLYYRLHVIPLTVPPLRDRLADIPILAHQFLSDYAEREGKTEKKITDEAITLLQQHDWPGNVRELKNVIERLVIMTGTDAITADSLPLLMKEHNVWKSESPVVGTPSSIKHAKHEFEKKFIAEKLREHNWNVSKTADAIGIERSNLHRKIKLFDLDDVKEK